MSYVIGHGDNVASMAWGACNLISTQVESKHPGKTFAECFPECVAHEKALAEGGGAASNKNPNKGGVGKTGGKKKSKDEDLSALLSEGLSVGKKKGKK